MFSMQKGDQLAMRTRMSIATAAIVGALALMTTPAVAQQNPTQDAYGGVIAEVVTPSKPTTPKPPAQQQAVQQSAPAAAQPSSGSLPFTGLQVTLVLLAGVALLGGGFVLRRATSA
jgi:hypothetical protein